MLLLLPLTVHSRVVGVRQSCLTLLSRGDLLARTVRSGFVGKFLLYEKVCFLL